MAQKAAKVGDYYFSNGSWESSGIVAGKTCIGVVFYVDPSDENGMTGKIVSLDEADQLQWSLASAGQPGAVSETDGLVNLDAIRSVNGWENTFAAEAWCASKTDGGLQWYLPCHRRVASAVRRLMRTDMGCLGSSRGHKPDQRLDGNEYHHASRRPCRQHL